MDDDMANIIVAQLLYLDAVDPTKVPSCFVFAKWMMLYYHHPQILTIGFITLYLGIR